MSQLWYVYYTCTGLFSLLVPYKLFSLIRDIYHVQNMAHSYLHTKSRKLFSNFSNDNDLFYLKFLSSSSLFIFFDKFFLTLKASVMLIILIDVLDKIICV